MTTRIDHEVFTRAAERIERNGMVKGRYYRGWDEKESVAVTREKIREGDLKCCTYGALIAEAGEFEAMTYGDFLARTLGLDSNFDIPDWNDAPSRRKRDLVKAFRKAAVEAGA